MLRKINIRARLFSLIVLLTASTGLIILKNSMTIESVQDFGTQKAVSKILEAHREKLQVATHGMTKVMESIIRQYPDRDQHIAAMRANLKDIRFGENDSGYFFVSAGTVNVIHPVKPSLQGQDMKDVKDENGVYYFRELQQAAEAGGGFVEYIFPKPGAGPQPKLAYAELIPGTNYVLSTGIYIDDVIHKKEELTQHINDLVNESVQASILILVLGFGGVLWLGRQIAISISDPLKQSVSAAQQVSKGDLTVALVDEYEDECSRLTRNMQKMVNSLENLIGKILGTSQRLKQDADTFLDTATQLSSGFEEVKAQSGSISAASTQITTSVNSFAAATEQASANMTGLNTNLTEMTENLKQVNTDVENINQDMQNINAQSSEAVMVSVNANDAVQNTLRSMQQLNETTRRIDNVVGLINDIAQQTRMLALNATIEAASAGETGKGFAVVAAEVKNLAQQTTDANNEVSQEISRVQQVAAAVLANTQTVGEVIKKVSDTSQYISDSIDTNSQATAVIRDSLNSVTQAGRQVTLNLEEAAKGLREVARSSAEASSGVKDVDRNISGIQMAINDFYHQVTQTHQSAQVLNQLSATLAESTSTFKVRSRLSTEQELPSNALEPTQTVIPTGRS